MAAAQEQKSSTGPILGISGSVLMPIIFSVILFIALAGKANGTSPMQPINPAPGSTENTALNSLLAMSNKDAFMAANSSQITQLTLSFLSLALHVLFTSLSLETLRPN